MALEATWSTVKILQHFDVISFSDEATELMETIRRERKQERIRIKSAESTYKKREGTLSDLPTKTTPIPFQVRCVGFGTSLTNAAYFSRQGTGKTYCAIATCGVRFQAKQIKRLLVVCPKSVLPVWPKEFKKHAQYNYSISTIKNHWVNIEGGGEYLEVIVINYDKVKSRMKGILSWAPDMVVLDESHRIGSPTTHRSKACHKLGDIAKYKLILTGTPLGQDPLNIWSQYRFLNPDVYGPSWKCFKDEYAVLGGFKNKVVVGYRNIDKLTELMHSISFRITEKEVLDLPPQVNQILYCEPDPVTKKLYKKMDKDLGFTFKGVEVEVEHSVSRLVKLRQITSGILKIGEDSEDFIKIADTKIKLLEEFLRDNPDGKKVIFTSFKHEIRAIGELLDSRGIGYLTLHGGTSSEDRMSLEKRFTEEKDLDILIIQISTGAEGQDFTVADTAIFYSPAYSWIYTDQAKARIYRMGQTKKVRNIFLVMEGTIEEDIVNLLDKIGDLSTEILDTNRNYKLSRK